MKKSIKLERKSKVGISILEKYPVFYTYKRIIIFVKSHAIFVLMLI
jgi:hypothetical protein